HVQAVPRVRLGVLDRNELGTARPVHVRQLEADVPDPSLAPVGEDFGDGGGRVLGGCHAGYLLVPLSQIPISSASASASSRIATARSTGTTARTPPSRPSPRSSAATIARGGWRCWPPQPSDGYESRTSTSVPPGPRRRSDSSKEWPTSQSGGASGGRLPWSSASSASWEGRLPHSRPVRPFASSRAPSPRPRS